MNLKEFLLKIRILFTNEGTRSIGILLLILLFLFLLIIPSFIFERALRVSIDSYKSKSRDLNTLSSEYKILREKVSFIETKSSNPHPGGITSVVNDIASSIGIKGKIKAIKGVSTRQLKEHISEETAEIYIEKATLNELVNVFHKIETAPTILSVKRTNIKKSFDRPEMLDVSITLSLFNLQPETKQ